MKLGVSLPDDRVTFADAEAQRRGTALPAAELGALGDGLRLVLELTT